MMLRAIFFAVALFLVRPIAAEEPPRVIQDLGTLLNAAALNGVASTRTFTVGPLVNNTEMVRYKMLVLQLYFDYSSNAGAITTTCLVGRTVATATFAPSVCEVAAGGGTCTVRTGGVFTTASLSADTSWTERLGIEGYGAISCVVSHGGTPGASEKITVTGYLVGP